MPRGYRKDAIIIFLLLSFLFAYFYQGSAWNGNSRFDLIFASVEEKTFSIDRYYNQYLTFTGDHSYSNGHYYSDKAIGPAIIGALIYAPIYLIHNLTGKLEIDKPAVEMLLTFLVVGLPSAIAGMLMYLLCLYLSRKRLRSFLITLAITLGTMYFPYSITFFSHQFTSSLIFAAFFVIFFIKEKLIKPKGIILFSIGLLMGWAFISEFTCAAIILPLGIYYLITIWKMPSQPRWRAILLPVLGGLIPVVLQLVYDKICFGSPFSMGYENLDNVYFKTSMSQGLMGIGLPNLQVLYFMTFHPTLGLFWQSPVLILAFVGMVYGLIQRKYRIEVILGIFIIFSYLVLISGYYMWWGGSSLSSRHIIPILPFFCLLLVFLPDPFNWPVAALGIVSFVQMLIPAVSTVLVPDNHIPKLGTMKFFQFSNIYNFCLQRVFNPTLGTNIGIRIFHLKSWASLIPLSIGVIVMFSLFFWRDIFVRERVDQTLVNYSFPGKNSLKG